MTAVPRSIRRDEIESAFLSACAAELKALKPGNVHVFAAGHDMDISHFEKSAKAAAPIIANSDLAVGARIKQAVAASMKAAGCNTNLGIILLSVPLAAAIESLDTSTDLQASLTQVLINLDQHDADGVFAAIRLANPGGLGRAEKGDVHTSDGQIGIHDAMQLSADVDRIANAYVSNFEDIFSHHLPTLMGAQAHGDQLLLSDRPQGAPGHPLKWDNRVVTTLYMQMLQDFPDSHIVRKFGSQVARSIQDRARALKSTWAPLKGGVKAHQKLLDFDLELKKDGLNPGTSADFVVATLFTSHLCRFAAHESLKGPCPRPIRGAI